MNVTAKNYVPRSDLLVFLGYVLLALLMTYPLGAQLGNVAAGIGNDMWVSHWNNWWIRQALIKGHNPYWTPYLFYPQGVSLIWHSFSWLNTGLWLPLQALIGPLAAHGVTVLLTYVLGGYTTYLLAREVTGSRRAAFLAGLVFAFFPHRHAHRNQLKLLSTQWIPLFTLYLVRLTRQGRLRDGLKAGIALALCGLSSVQLMILSGIWACLWLFYSLMAERKNWSRRTVLALLLSGVTSGVLVAPFFVPLVLAQLNPYAAQGLAAGNVGEGATDLVAYFVPSRYHPLLQSGALKAVYDRWVHFSSVAAVGYTTLGLAVWAVVKRWRKARFWALSALFFAVLALGSTLQVNGRVLPGLPMPYRLLAPTWLGEALRRPSRFNLILALPVAILVAIGLAALLGRLRSRRRAGFVTVCIGALILFEYLVLPFPTTEPIRSAFYYRLSQEVGEFAVADFPIGFHAHDKWYMYAQTLHSRPMVGGHVSRVPVHAHDFINSVPLLEAARTAPPGRGTLVDISRQLRPLAEAEVQYVLIHKYRARPDEVDGWREWFAVQPWYEDEYLLVFRTAPRYGQDLQFAGEVGDGIGVIEATLSAEAVAQDGLLEAEVVWGTRQPPEREWAAYLALSGPAGQEMQSVVFEPCPGWPTWEWSHDAVARGRGTLRVDPLAEGGAYTVTVGLLNPVTGVKAGEALVVGQVKVQAVERVFESPEMEVESAAVFGALLRLLGYDLRREDDQAIVTLHWQALRRMDTSYKIFVHLVDSATGTIVAQDDAVPRRWAYPTTWWQEGEVVSDEMPLSLENVPAGRYQVAMGVYHPETGERLSVVTGGEPMTEGSLILAEEIVR